MSTTSFNDDWFFLRELDEAPQPVHIPHDAMLVEGRSATSPAGAHNGHFLGGRYSYSKHWIAPEGFATMNLSLLFEGVFGTTTVRVNGSEVATNTNAYTEFEAPLTAALRAGDNLIEVDVDNSHQPNSRWYTGSGLYRRIRLQQGTMGRPQLARDGVRFRTVSIGSTAAVEVDIELSETATTPTDATVALFDGDTIVTTVHAETFKTSTLRLTVPAPKLWSDRAPHLYRAVVELRTNGEMTDARTLSVGVRTIAVESRDGLRVNGRTVLLRGACVHHDSGVLGAATYRAAEFRRASILKEHGFNAIRSAHNPISRDLLDACDELGLYVIDELTDVWTSRKTAHDSAATFAETWRDDARAMVAKDRNHPSVIMYSIGNENAETASVTGVELAHQLSQLFRELDPTRPTTVAINFLLNVLASFKVSAFGEKDAGQDTDKHAKRAKKEPSKVTSTLANAVTNKIGGLMDLVGRLPKADKNSRDAFAAVDVAGYNYAAGRYRADAKRHPDRIIVGSETMPGAITRNWALVKALPNVIGDFMWTGWDYLGEAGIGSWSYGEGASVMNKPYPNVIAGPGAIDITGTPGAPSFLARAVWGELDRPTITVRPLDHAGEKTARSAWRSTDALPSWSWAGSDGKPAQIEVYSADEQIELVLNGRSLGRRRAGRKAGYVTRFRTPYEPGEIVAIGYRNNTAVTRSSLRSSSSRLRLTAAADRQVLDASGDDLAFIRLALVDQNGVVEMLASDEMRVDIAGPGVLAGFGNGGPGSERSFLDNTQDTYYGTALAVIRAVSVGVIHVSATSTRYGAAELELFVSETTSSSAQTPALDATR